MKKLNLKKAFTLIELLIVIGILAILVVTVLVSLNPGEAQKKARDTKRMRDITTIQTALQQYLNDGGAPVCTVAAGCTTAAAAPLTACAASWITGANLCQYIQALPIDPSNNSTRRVVESTDNCATFLATNLATIYRVKMDTGGNYEINAVQESTENCKNVVTDNGNSNQYVEIFSEGASTLY